MHEPCCDAMKVLPWVEWTADDPVCSFEKLEAVRLHVAGESGHMLLELLDLTKLYTR
jgi:hypothetical protein